MPGAGIKKKPNKNSIRTDYLLQKLKHLAGNRLVCDGAIYGVSTALERGTIVCASFLASLSLDESQFSEFGQFQIAVTMVAGFSTLGMSTLVAKLATEMKLGRGDSVHSIRAISYSTIVLSFFLCLLYLMFEAIFAVSHTFTYSLVFAAACMAISQSVIISSTMLGLEKYKQSLYVSAAGFMTMVVGFVFARVLSSFEANIMAFAAVYTAMVVAGIRLAGNRLLLTPSRPLGFQRLHGLAGQVRPLVAASVLSSSTTWVLSTTLLKTSNSLEHSMFLIGLQWSAIATFIPSVLTRVVFPSMVKRGYDRDEKADKMALPIKIGAASALFAVLLAAVAWVASGFLDLLYAGKYPDIAYIVIVYILCSVPQSVANLFGNLLVADNRGAAWLASCFIGWLGILVTVWTTRNLGALAPAIATFFGYTFMIAASIILLRRKPKNSLSHK
jgi:O-antigen/teichoic acid export membrane protein